MGGGGRRACTAAAASLLASPSSSKGSAGSATPAGPAPPAPPAPPAGPPAGPPSPPPPSSKSNGTAHAGFAQYAIRLMHVDWMWSVSRVDPRAPSPPAVTTAIAVAKGMGAAQSGEGHVGGYRRCSPTATRKWPCKHDVQKRWPQSPAAVASVVATLSSRQMGHDIIAVSRGEKPEAAAAAAEVAAAAAKAAADRAGPLPRLDRRGGSEAAGDRGAAGSFAGDGDRGGVGGPAGE